MTTYKKFIFSAITLGFCVTGLYVQHASKLPQGRNSHAFIDSIGSETSLHSFNTRPVYEYSLINGGFSTISELQRIVAQDPLLVGAFAGFQWNRATCSQTTERMEVFVAGRADGKIFWSKRLVVIPKGTGVCSDGVLTALMRCGNLISATPKYPYIDIPPIEFELPIIPGSTEDSTNTNVVSITDPAPPIKPTTNGSSTVYYTPTVWGGEIVVERKAKVDEPGLGILLALGLIPMWGVEVFIKQRGQK